MTLKDALRNIASSRTNDACKMTSMGGYFFRDGEVSQETGSEGNFTLVMRKRSNDGGGHAQDFTLNYDAGFDIWEIPSGGSVPTFTGELFGELIGDDWIVGKQADFERSRVPAQSDEW